jgi:hypothetical protein
MKSTEHKLRTRRETLLHARLDSPFELLVAFLWQGRLNSAKTYTLDYFMATFWHTATFAAGRNIQNWSGRTKAPLARRLTA